MSYSSGMSVNYCGKFSVTNALTQCLRHVMEVEPLWELKVQLDCGALVGPLQGIHQYNVNLGGQER